jgi:NAD(P)-dependent dehydrogenase (short-subunit alcohol dehydrogenase family)
MTQKLKGKSAVVTGAGGGIGRGIAIALAKEGASVVVNDIGHDSQGNYFANKVVEEIKKADNIAVPNFDNVATMAGGENIIKTATGNFGKIDILVNCAGNFWPVPSSVKLTEQEWDSIINVHLKGHFSCTRAAASEMIKQKQGRIINFSSRGAFFTRGNLAYNTAKAGIMGFTAMLSKEFSEYGITVNAILPSAVTNLFPNDKFALGDNMPMLQKPDPDSVAPIVVFLSTDEAKDITGQFIYAAGGDICIYSEPIKLTAAHRFIRKVGGNWTLDELNDTIPSLIKPGS